MNPHSDFHPRSCRGGFIKSLLFTLLFLAAALVVAWVFLLPVVLKSQVAGLTGCSVEIERFNANPFGATVRLENLALRNPSPEFATPAFVDLKLLDCEIKPVSLRAERLDIPRLHIDLQKVTLVTNKDGLTNAMFVKQRLEEKLGPLSSEGETKFLIGELVVRLGSIEMIDYSKGPTPTTRTVQLGINQRFTNVSDPSVVMVPIMTDILTANAGALNSMLPPDMQKKLGGALQGAAPLLENLGGLMGEKGQQQTDQLKKLFDSLQSGNKP